MKRGGNRQNISLDSVLAGKIRFLRNPRHPRKLRVRSRIGRRPPRQPPAGKSPATAGCIVRAGAPPATTPEHRRFPSERGSVSRSASVARGCRSWFQHWSCWQRAAGHRPALLGSARIRPEGRSASRHRPFQRPSRARAVRIRFPRAALRWSLANLRGPSRARRRPGKNFVPHPGPAAAHIADCIICGNLQLFTALVVQ